MNAGTTNLNPNQTLEILAGWMLGQINSIRPHNAGSSGAKKFVVEKGSISINGVSLTVSKLNSQSFEVTIIPHTLKLTNLVKLKVKDIVNVEFDMIGKYLNKIYN